MKVSNVSVYGIEESIRGAKFPMSTDPESVNFDLTPGIDRLAHAPIGSGHDNFLNGVIVQFDLKCSNKMWVEMERYHFIDFVSSQSTMHRATKMFLPECVNKFVTEATIAECARLQQEYKAEPNERNYLTLLYNIPSGIELTARMTTNYRQLKTIYRQRKDHRLPEWREFCRWMATLPHGEWITN